MSITNEMTNEMTDNRHYRVIELEEALAQEGLPLEQLKESFILVNIEVLKHPELVELMGAEEIGLVTQAASRLLDMKLAPKKEKKEKKEKKVPSAKAQIAAIAKAAKETEEEEEDWSML